MKTVVFSYLYLAVSNGVRNAYRIIHLAWTENFDTSIILVYIQIRSQEFL